MQPVSPDAKRYDARTMAFHWATLAVIVVQFASAWTIDDFPRGPLRVDARSFHITLGLVIALLVAGRMMWRATGGRRLPFADHNPALNVLAKGTHWVLYALLVTMVLLGITLTWARGDSIWNLFSIPSFAPGNRDLVHTIEDLHGTVGWAIIGLAGFHASAALLHYFVLKDGTLQRMLPVRTAAGLSADPTVESQGELRSPAA